MFGPRLKVGDGDLHRLNLLMFGRDGADFIAHLVSFHRHVLTLDAGRGMEKDLKRCVQLKDEAVEMFCST